MEDLTEERIQRMEGQVADLRVSSGGLSITVGHLADEVKTLAVVVAKLNDTVSRGKGALAVIGIIGVAVGSLVHWLLDFFGVHK